MFRSKQSFYVCKLVPPFLAVALVSLSPLHAAGLPRASHPPQTVPQCSSVTLRASYLAEEKPGSGAGFLLEIRNGENTPIAVVDPVPLSVHWYAASGGRWLWRASSGSGGSLVNALRENGPVFADQRPADAPAPVTRTIPPHAAYSWTVFSGDSPVLRYRPGCEHCKYPGEEQFRAVLAYAYLPEEGEHGSKLLRCGLRSEPVVMPPLPDSQKAHNSNAQ